MESALLGRQVYKRVGISPAEVYNWKDREIMSSRSIKGPWRANWRGLVIYSSSKDSALFIVPLWLLTTVKRGATLQTRYVTGVPFVNRRYTIGAPFLTKMVHVYERGKRLDLGAKSPHIEHFWVALLSELGAYIFLRYRFENSEFRSC